MPADPFRGEEGSLREVLLEGELALEQVAALLRDPDAGWPAAFRAAIALDDDRNSVVLYAAVAYLVDEAERKRARLRKRRRRKGRPRWWSSPR